MHIIKWIVFIIVMILPHSKANGKNTDTLELRELIRSDGLDRQFDKSRVTDINTPLSQLGKKLFFSKSLSGDKDVACATCHHPVLGGGDALSLPIGTGAVDPDVLGPGRSHKENASDFNNGLPNVPRNAPTTFNLFIWDKFMFADGRIELLDSLNNSIRTPDTEFGVPDNAAGKDIIEAQSRFPVTSAAEMRGFSFEKDSTNQAVRDHLSARLGDYGIGKGEISDNNWKEEFINVFGSEQIDEELFSYSNIAKAIASYELSQDFTDSPWQNFISGDNNAISSQAKKGALLFFKNLQDGGANCASCHSGNKFTDESFHNLAFPQIGEGKGDFINGSSDFGRMRETNKREDVYTFRTPSLLNVSATFPYGHAGSFDTLYEAIEQHSSPFEKIENYNKTFSKTSQFKGQSLFQAYPDAIVNSLEAASEINKNNDIRVLNEYEIKQLVAFLETLTDPCIKDRNCLAPWIPLDQESPDENQLKPIDAKGKRL